MKWTVRLGHGVYGLIRYGITLNEGGKYITFTAGFFLGPVFMIRLYIFRLSFLFKIEYWSKAH